MMRCCDGDTYVRADNPRYDDNAIGVRHKTPIGRQFNKLEFLGFLTDEPPRPEAWAVCCFDCDAVLAVVTGPREEVFADL